MSDNNWIELPEDVYEKIMNENFWKAFWFGFVFACFLFVVFIAGILLS